MTMIIILAAMVALNSEAVPSAMDTPLDHLHVAFWWAPVHVSFLWVPLHVSFYRSVDRLLSWWTDCNLVGQQSEDHFGLPSLVGPSWRPDSYFGLPCSVESR